MNDKEVIKRMIAYLDCLDIQTAGECCNDCENCPLCYEIGTFGQCKQVVEYVINRLLSLPK